MDENLQQLTRDLRKETCPQRVLDEVARRISAQPPAPNRFRYAIAGALTALIVLGGIALWRWPIDKGSPPAPQLVQTDALLRQKHYGGQAINRALVARQAEGTLAYIGQVMVHAGAHSEKVILNETVPQLRNSFETAKNKIMNRIEL
jgi:hypothetical protein